MRPYFLALALLLAIFVAADVSTTSAQQPPDDDDVADTMVSRGGQQFPTQKLVAAPEPERGRQARVGGIIVKFKPGTSDAQRNDAHRGAGAQRVEALLLPDAQRVKVPQAQWGRALLAYRNNPR